MNARTSSTDRTGHRDAGLDVADDVLVGLADRDHVRGPGQDGVGEHRRVLAEVRVGRPQQPVQVDVADDADARTGG